MPPNREALKNFFEINPSVCHILRRKKNFGRFWDVSHSHILWIYNTGFSVDIQNYYPEIGYTSNQTCNNGPITLVSDSKCIHKDSCDIQFSSDC